ncbi:allene oxide synthase-lipoxygenase protein-like [Mercenaria mercenaria]|uniref:allene oxide synthase-lipoxygenase protein-like n=1 Tax=Mercenaria mercenaria TaxID=6596 RepID=UPI00234F4783|nr:allene oxide synthase-lipoxygenase protein-like [Mercenaria mercenaria]
MTDSRNPLQNGDARELGDSLCEDFTISVESADIPKGVCSGIIHVKLLGDDGIVGEEEELAALEFPKEIKRGHKHTFQMNCKMMNVIGINIRGDMMVGKVGWNIDRMTVQKTMGGTEAIIPIFTSIKSGRSYTFMVNDVELPQNSSRKEDRKEYFKEMGLLYELSDEQYPGCPPLVKKLPKVEQFSHVYKDKIIKESVQVGLDAVCRELPDKLLHQLGPFQTIDDIQKLYDCDFPEPSNLNRWRNDVFFGFQRLMGNNCSTICVCTKIPENLVVDNVKLKLSLEGKQVEEALAGKRIFIIDYKILEGLPTKQGYIITAPIALFYQRDDGILVPIAIQLFQKKGMPVFYPDDPENVWILAKMWFNVADANYHESVAHLGFTHMKMEGIVACTYRTIYKTHPIYKLLMPHFLYLLAINSNGLPVLLGKDGFVSKVLALGPTGMVELIRKKNKDWRLDRDGDLVNDLRNRGVYDPNLLPHYYYRDDALELNACIRSYVTKYLDLYYKSDNDVKKDEELQNWRKEIIAPVKDQGLGMLGVYGDNDEFSTKDQVSRTLTNIIFTCSAQHAAVNFRQYEEYAYPPNYPAILQGKPPKNKSRIDDKQLLKYLPDKTTTYDTLIITSILSMRAMNKLGDFEVCYITDKNAVEVVKEFQANLKRIAKSNKVKNQTRLERYTCLSPDLVPNSISI